MHTKFAGAISMAFNDKARNLELYTVGNTLNKFKSNLKLVNDVNVFMCVEGISRSRHFCIESSSSFGKERNAGGHACNGFESSTNLLSSLSFLISSGIVKILLKDKSKSTKESKRSKPKGEESNLQLLKQSTRREVMHRMESGSDSCPSELAQE
jgi:hypothetical protein